MSVSGTISGVIIGTDPGGGLIDSVDEVGPYAGNPEFYDAAGDRLASSYLFDQSPASVGLKFSSPLLATSPSDPHSVTNLANWRLLQNGADASHLIAAVTVIPAASPDGAILYSARFTGELPTANYRLIALDSIHGENGKPLNGDTDGTAGGNITVKFQISPYRTASTGENLHARLETPVVAAYDSGHYVVGWIRERINNPSAHEIVVQMYHPSGERYDLPRVVAQSEGGTLYSSLRISTSGHDGFTVAWQATNLFAVTATGSPSWLQFKHLDADGRPEEVLYTPQGLPSYGRIHDLARADDGSLIFVVGQNLHTSFIPAEQQDPERGPAVYVARTSASGVAIGEPIRMGLGGNGRVALGSDGRYVVTWDDGTKPSRGVLAQHFAADGTPTSPVVRLSYRAGQSSAADVALDPSGNAVITWLHRQGDKARVMMQRLSPNGRFLGGEVEVSPAHETPSAGPSIAMGKEGQFIIGWSTPTETYSPVRVQAFDPTAIARGPGLIPVGESNARLSPNLAFGEDGEIILVWTHQTGDGSLNDPLGSQLSSQVYISASVLNYEPLRWRFAVDLNGDRSGVNYQTAYVPGEEAAPISDAGKILKEAYFYNDYGSLLVDIENRLPGDLIFSDTLESYQYEPQGFDGQLRIGYQDVGEFLASARFTSTANRPAGSEVRIKFRLVNYSGYEPDYSDPAYTTISIHAPGVAEVAGRHIFYNDSTLDGNNPAANVADDAAIAADKSALLPGQTATFANVTSYSAGINGIMVDLTGVHGVLDANDFVFRIGTSSDTTHWADAPEPKLIKVRHNQGTAGSDRVEIIWDRGAIQNVWLQVTVLANGNTGLADPDVFYFGNRIGDTGNEANRAQPQTIEALALINRLIAGSGGLTAAQGDPDDFNRDGRITTADLLVVFNAILSQGAPLEMIAAPEVSSNWEPPQSLTVEQTSVPAAPLAAVFAAWDDDDARALRLSLVGAGLLMEEPEEN